VRYGENARQRSSLPCARKKTHGKLGFSCSELDYRENAETVTQCTQHDDANWFPLGYCNIRPNLDGPWVAHERRCMCLVPHC
jgi:hypothetical protein